jgi:hypothetical protein
MLGKNRPVDDLRWLSPRNTVRPCRWFSFHREVDREIGRIDAVNECLPVPRDPRYVVHEQRSMLAQRIFAMALGYEDLHDHQTLKSDVCVLNGFF